jgi:hypothetical protein
VEAELKALLNTVQCVLEVIHTHLQISSHGHNQGTTPSGRRGGSLADLGSEENLEQLKRHQIPVLDELKQVIIWGNVVTMFVTLVRLLLNKHFRGFKMEEITFGRRSTSDRVTH